MADPTAPNLSERARALLVEAALDKTGLILRIQGIGAFRLQTHGREFTKSGAPQDMAVWDPVLEELGSAGLLLPVGDAHGFRITDEGRRVAALISEN